MNRRALLAVLSAGSMSVVSGCTGLISGDSDTSSTDADEPSTSEPEQLESENQEQSESEPDYSPEPRYFVAEDGSGDYETVEEAIQVVQDGDILGLKPGEYEWKPVVQENQNTYNQFDKEITFVGKESSSTTLTISPRGSSFSVGNKNPQFHNLTVTLADSVNWEAGQTYAGGGDGAVRPVKFNHCKISGSIEGSFHANHSQFETDAAPIDAVIRDCSFQGQVRVGEATIERSEIMNGAVGVGECRLTECTIRSNTDDVAVRMTEGGGSIRHCEIRGQVRNSRGTWRANRFIADSGSYEFFIDDSGPNKMWGNIFHGADIRVAGSVTMYEEEEGLGNYYSEWDGASDDDGDGISDLPRPIPGDSDITDQYPLVEDNVSAYGMKPEDVPFYSPPRE